MKRLSVEQQTARFKKKHGDGEASVTSEGRLFVPLWLANMLLHLSGIRSKKKRIIKKTLTREIHKLLESGLAIFKNEA